MVISIERVVINIYILAKDRYEKMRNYSRATSKQRNFHSSTRRYARSSSTSTANSSSQQSSIKINAENLRLPYLLRVNLSGNKLTGYIKINGKVIKQLNLNNHQFNLSPYLSIDKNTIEILAQYEPPSSVVEIEFLGCDTRVVQQTSGSGVLDYTLVVMVE